MVIEGGRAGDFVVVEVSDTGTGIPPEVMEHMWEPFVTTKGPGQGTAAWGFPRCAGLSAPRRLH